METISTQVGKTLLAGLLGMFLFISTGQAANYDAGIFEFQQKLAKAGNPQAQYKLADMYENGRGASKDILKAKQWYKKSAANNYKPAKHRLTYLDVKAGGFKASHKPWLKDLSADAKKGDVEAMFLLGEMNEKGTGIKKNLKQAKAYYKAASIKGSVDAENRLYDIEDQLHREKANKIARQEKKLAEKEAKHKKKETATRKAKQQSTKSNKQKKAQLKAIQERNRLTNERRQLAEEKRKLEAQQKALAKREAAAKASSKEKKDAGPEGFESDLCSGRAARFRTQCK